MYNLPIAKIIKYRKTNYALRTVLEIDRDISSPIAPASLWMQHALEETTAAVLELHKLVKREAKTFTFETYDSEAEPLILDSTYFFISWWEADQLAIAQSSPGQWYKQEYTPQDAVQFHTKDGAIMRRKLVKSDDPAGTTVISDGWDHEHCFLCWQSISQKQGDEKTGYTDGRDWLCEACYEKYIASGFGRKLGETH